MLSARPDFKTGSAQRQLDCAIRLYLAEEDDLAVHILSRAAFSDCLRSHGLDEFPANPFEATGASSNNDAEVNSEEVPFQQSRLVKSCRLTWAAFLLFSCSDGLAPAPGCATPLPYA